MRVGDAPPDTSSQVQLAQATARAASSTTSSTLVSSVGVGGGNDYEDVRHVQEWLQRVGFALNATGFFDGPTQISLDTAFHICENFAKGARTLLYPGTLIAERLRDGTFPKWVEMPRNGTGFKRYDAG